MTLNSGKCYGPKQTGCLFVRAGVELQPLICGGGQEMNLRSGTENVASVVGFAKALEIAEKKRKSEVERLGKLRDDLEGYLIDTFKELDIEIKINGHPKYRLPSLINFSIPGLDGERVVFALDARGLAVATGSACAASKDSRSHVLSTIGLGDDLIDGSIRISLGRPTTESEIEQTKSVLVEVIQEQLKFRSQ
jgi:cysteine desulfurase